MIRLYISYFMYAYYVYNLMYEQPGKNIILIKIWEFFSNILQSNYHPILFTYNEGQEEKLQLNPNRNASNKSIPNIKKQKEKKPFDKRKGDWLCPDCHNLNFAFRIICNRCQKSKPSDTIDNNEQ